MSARLRAAAPAATLLGLAALLLAAPARAAPPAPLEPARLTLSATGRASVTPDVLDAVLLASATGGDPAAVQREVNRSASAAVAEAGRVSGLAIGLPAYATGKDDKGAWTATATLDLSGREGDALLALVGRLQADGLSLSSLDWRLSPELRETAEGEAERRAILALRTRAAGAADALGLRLAGLVEMRLEPEQGGFRPMVMARLRDAAAPPLADPRQEVEATVSATLLLAPR